jgi:dienelactone hydrolase
VFPEAFGLGEHAIEKAERIAQELGYVALACDLNGERRAIGMDGLAAALGPLRSSAEKVRARTGDALAALLGQPGVDPSRIAAIGYCFGGTMAFELALSGADIKAAIGFHSGPDQREAFHRMLTDAGVDWQMSLYGGVVHSFTNPEADKAGRPEFLRYDERADRRSWNEMAALMQEVFAS